MAAWSGEGTYQLAVPGSAFSALMAAAAPGTSVPAEVGGPDGALARRARAATAIKRIHGRRRTALGMTEGDRGRGLIVPHTDCACNPESRPARARGHRVDGQALAAAG